MSEETASRTRTVIAIVDDDESVRAALESLLRSGGYCVRSYGDAAGFLASDSPEAAHCLISDIQMPGMSGLQLHERLVARGLRIPTLFVSASPGAALGPATGIPGVVARLPKPFDAERLLECVEIALRQPR